MGEISSVLIGIVVDLPLCILRAPPLGPEELRGPGRPVRQSLNQSPYDYRSDPFLFRRKYILVKKPRDVCLWDETV